MCVCYMHAVVLVSQSKKKKIYQGPCHWLQYIKVSLEAEAFDIVHRRLNLHLHQHPLHCANQLQIKWCILQIVIASSGEAPS